MISNLIMLIASSFGFCISFYLKEDRFMLAAIYMVLLLILIEIKEKR